MFFFLKWSSNFYSQCMKINLKQTKKNLRKKSVTLTIKNLRLKIKGEDPFGFGEKSEGNKLVWCLERQHSVGSGFILQCTTVWNGVSVNGGSTSLTRQNQSALAANTIILCQRNIRITGKRCLFMLSRKEGTVSYYSLLCSPCK